MKEEAQKADLGSLRIEGDRAFVIYSGPGKTILAMPVASEEGASLIDIHGDSLPGNVGEAEGAA